MSTPKDEIPNKSTGNTDTKVSSEKLTSFLDSIVGKSDTEQEYDSIIKSLIKMIAEGSFDEKSVKTFFSIRNAVRRDNDNVCVRLGNLIGQGLKQKDLSEIQIKDFFNKVLALNETDDTLLAENKFLKGLSRYLYGGRRFDQEPSFLIELVSAYFLKMATWENEDARVSALEALENLRPHTYANQEIFVRCYKSIQSAKVQDILLRAFIVGKEPDLIFNLKISNPKIFEKFYQTLEEKSRKEIDETIEKSENSLISLIEKGDLKGAAEIFIWHPKSPIILFEALEENSIDKTQINEFLQILLKSEYCNMQIGFSAIKSCLDSTIYLQNPNLSIELLSSYLGFAFESKQVVEACTLLSSRSSYNDHILNLYNSLPEVRQKMLAEGFMVSFNTNKNTSLMLGLSKSNPALFEHILSSQDEKIRETIRALLSSHSINKDMKIKNEWSVGEERLLLDFNIFLDDSKNFKKEFVRDFKEALEKINTNIEDNYNKFPELSKTMILRFLKKGIELDKVNVICDLLAEKPLWTDHILDAYSRLSADEQTSLLSVFLESCGSKYNAALIAGLKALNPKGFDAALGSKNENLKKRINDLLKVPAEARLMVSDVMEQFSLPFRRMEEYSARLFSAVTASRKHYTFNPTVLVSSQLKEYLEILKHSKPPVRERFFLGGDHWISGEIEIPEKGNPRILFLDSLGKNEPKTHDIIKQQCAGVFEYELDKEGLMRKGLEVYLSDGKRQKSGLGCTLFTFRDVQDLYTIEEYEGYLEPQYEGSLWNYVTGNSRGYVPEKLQNLTGLVVKPCILPLRFMRIQQDARVLASDTIPGRRSTEQSLIITKPKPGETQGETALESSAKHFRKYRDKDGIEGERNERLVYKLEEMGKDVFAYLVKNKFDFVKIESEMEKYSLETLKERMKARKTPDERKSTAERAKTNILHQFALHPTPGLAATLQSNDEPERKKSMEISSAYSKISELFLEKFKFHIFSLNTIIKMIGNEYDKNNITDVDSLKNCLKDYWKGADNNRLFFIDDPKNKEHFEVIFQNLSIMQGPRPNNDVRTSLRS